MGDLTKWEAKSAKINIIIPIVSIAAVFLIVGVAALYKPPPPEATKKKDPNEAAMIDETADEAEVDWENF